MRSSRGFVQDLTSQANATENADLFWALKGGGANFGIVTRLDLDTYPDYKIWVSVRTFAAQEVPKVMEAVTTYQKAMENDENLGFNAVGVPGFLSTAVIYRGHLDEAHPACKVFDDIEAVKPTPRKNSICSLCSSLWARRQSNRGGDAAATA